MLIYKLEDVCFQYDKSYCLNHVSLEIEDGKFYLICGKSGSGKTTLLKLLKKQMQPQGFLQGNIEYCHNNIDSQLSHEIGYLFQNPEHQIVTHKVIHELSFGLENMAMPLQQMKRRVSEVVHFFNLQSLLHTDISHLSGGQKQIVNLASLVAMQPKVMLLDEPTAQLDPIACQEFLSLLKRINDEFNITIIMVEHDLEQTFHLCDQVIYLHNGTIEYNGKPSSIPYLNDFEDVLPISIQLFHKINTYQTIPLDMKTTRTWLKENKEHFHVIGKKEEKNQDVVIKIQNLHFHYNEYEILKGLDLEIYNHDILAIVGSNGSGKSTLLKNICGLLKKDRGKITIQGTDINHIKNLFQGYFACLPQDPTTLFLKETVKEELNYEDEKIQMWIHDLGLDKLYEQHPYDLSGGQMQLVALIKVLSSHPQFLLLDEPTKGLDIYYKNQIGNLLKKINNETTIIIVSHDLEFCAKYASRVGMMFEGRIEAIESTKTFFTSNLFYTTMLAKLTRGIIDDAYVLDDLIYE